MRTLPTLAAAVLAAEGLVGAAVAQDVDDSEGEDNPSNHSDASQGEAD